MLRSLHALAGTLRLPFLLLTSACVALGAVLARPVDGAMPIQRLALVLLGALLAQPQALPAALALGLALLALAGACGLVLMWLLPADARLALLLLGVVGLGLVLAYTPWLTRQPLLCLLAPGLGFGPLMAPGTQLALAGGSMPAALVASLLPWCQVSGLLLLNQFPDVEADRHVGRRHLPLLWGRRRAAALRAALLLGALATLAWGVATGALGGGAALGLLSAPLAAWVAWGAWRHADDLPALVPTMGRNVLLCLCTPLLVALGLVLWR